MSTIKIGSLVVRTLAKPVANSIKNQAKQHPSFRDFCINVAQTAHRLEMNMKMNFLGYKREVIRPLNDAKAIETGANFLSESILFTVGATLIIAETARSRIQSNRRNQFLDGSIENLNKESSSLKETIAESQALAKKLQEQVEDLKKDNTTLQEIINEILSVSMGLRNHTAYDRPIVMTIPGFEPSDNKENMIALAGEQRDGP